MPYTALRLITILIVSGLTFGAAGIGSAPTTRASAADRALQAARAAAVHAAGRQDLGGTISFMGVLGGEQQDQYLSTIKPFEEATGVTVEYEATRDLLAVLQTRVEGGNPPDVVSSPAIGQMADLARDGTLVDLSQFLDAATLQADFDQGLLDLGSHDGKVFGIFVNAAVKGLIWHNPKQYTGPTPPTSWEELQTWAAQTAADGTPPWCIGLESGPASGWPATDWIENFLLRQAGPETYDRWWRGELPWTSPEVRTAFESFGAIASDPELVSGGPTAVVATSFLNGGDGLFADPPTCFLHHQADWFGAAMISNHPGVEPVDDVNFFPFPDIDPAHAGVVETSGEIVGAFNDTPQVRALMTYLTTPEAQAILAGTGSWLAPNKRVPLDAYPTALSRQAAEVLTSATAVRFDASDLMPQAMNEGFWRVVLNYVQDPDALDDLLADLDAKRPEAYQ